MWPVFDPCQLELTAHLLPFLQGSKFRKRLDTQHAKSFEQYRRKLATYGVSAISAGQSTSRAHAVELYNRTQSKCILYGNTIKQMHHV
jgi:hypothetical protein